MKLALCNEVIREMDFARQCALAAGMGYAGLELAPFTLGEDTYRMGAAQRAATRRALFPYTTLFQSEERRVGKECTRGRPPHRPRETGRLNAPSCRT